MVPQDWYKDVQTAALLTPNDALNHLTQLTMWVAGSVTWGKYLFGAASWCVIISSISQNNICLSKFIISSGNFKENPLIWNTNDWRRKTIYILEILSETFCVISLLFCCFLGQLYIFVILFQFTFRKPFLKCHRNIR